MDFKAEVSRADRENGEESIRQIDIVEILQSMRKGGLSEDEAYDLYIAEYAPKDRTNTDGKLNVYDVREAGVPVDVWLSFKYNINAHLVPGVDYPANTRNARRDALIDLLQGMGLSANVYNVLYRTEYKS